MRSSVLPVEGIGLHFGGAFRMTWTSPDSLDKMRTRGSGGRTGRRNIASRAPPVLRGIP